MSDKAMAWARTVHTGSASKKLVLLVLADQADNQGYVSENCTQVEIAAEAELSVRQVRRLLRELSPFYERAHRAGEGGGRLSDTFRLKMKEMPAIVGASPGQAANLSPKASGQIEQASGHLEGGKRTSVAVCEASGHSPQTPLEFTPSKRVPKGTPKGSPDFEALWGLWRTKDLIRRAKRKPAFETHQRLVRAGNDPRRIMAGAAAYLANAEMTRESGRYMPDLFRWLRDEVWADWADDNAPAGIDWAKREHGFRTTGLWNPNWGPEPGRPGYRGQPQDLFDGAAA